MYNIYAFFFTVFALRRYIPYIRANTRTDVT